MSEQHHIVDAYADRKAANDKSKALARRDGARWTEDEDNFLITEWIKVPTYLRDEVVVAECLERTIESCRVRCNKIRQAHGWDVKYTSTTTTTVEYRGLMDDPDDCFWSPDYYTNGK